MNWYRRLTKPLNESRHTSGEFKSGLVREASVEFIPKRLSGETTKWELEKTGQGV